MSAQILTNPYRGINAHLNSFLQTPGSETRTAKWHSFHASHIGHITDFMNDILPTNYIAHSEQSLQIRSESFEFGSVKNRRIPDISLYHSGSSVPSRPTGAITGRETNAFEIMLDETLPEDDEFTISAVVIRELVEDEDLGKVVARLELLSPSNKLGDDGYEAYRKGRSEALYSLVPLIELDYLHESPLPFRYPRTQAYYITISDPRPSVDQGHVTIHPFDVDEPIPIVNIPLAGSDEFTFDFGKVYQHTFERGRWGMYCDYSTPPARFGTYSPADQERIRAVMQRVSTPSL